jgi:hypothetical protein
MTLGFDTEFSPALVLLVDLNSGYQSSIFISRVVTISFRLQLPSNSAQ